MSLFNTRVSSYQLNYFMRSNVNSATTKLQEASKELGTGKHANMFKELGARSASVLTMRVQETNTQSYITSNGVLGNKLEATLTAANSVRSSVQSVLELGMLNVTRPNLGADTLQIEARAAIESIIGSLNQSFNGDHLFAGVKSREAPMNRWNETNAATGFSPEDVMNSVVGAGPTTAANAATMSAEIQSIFDSTFAADPNKNFEATFFTGTPLLDGSGNPNPRVTARLAPDQELAYGVQANDQPVRDILRGLAMLASVDVSQISDAATYQAWMEEATDALSAGSEGMLRMAADIGFQQEIVETSVQRLDDVSIVQRSQVARLENVDTYEVATRISSFEAQLQASYSVTARLGELSLLRYMR